MNSDVEVEAYPSVNSSKDTHITIRSLKNEISKLVLTLYVLRIYLLVWACALCACVIMEVRE